MYNQYRFVDRWSVPAPQHEVYDLVGDTLGYPSWWGEVFLSVEGDGGPPRSGRRVTIVSRGFLPYLLHWHAEIVEAERPRGFSFTMNGDFIGEGSWTFEEANGRTTATFVFSPRVEKPLVKYLTPLLRPLFRANHGWAMRRGERGLRALFVETGQTPCCSGVLKGHD